MTDSNRTQIAYIKETTLGTTPAYSAAAFRTARITGESLARAIQNIISEELRADRQVSDLVQVAGQNNGDINFELSFPQFNTFFYDFLPAAFFSDWLKSAERYNITSDSVITAATASSDTFTVTTGTAFAEGHLVRASGFTNSGNNQLFRAAAGSGATAVIAPASPGLTDEAAPPAGARLKVVGFEGASADITATGSGLGSTLLDFTTLGLRVGQWIKIGGTAAGTKFATAALNTFVRITAIAAAALTCDNLPSGWATDAGTGKTIQVWVSDVLRNGVTRSSFSVEKGYLAQTVPSYMLFAGQVLGGMTLNLAAEQIVKGSFSMLGTAHSAGTATFGSPAAASTVEVLNAVSNVARVAEAGALITGPNYIRSLHLTVNNNLRGNTAIGTLGFVDIGVGRFEVSGSIETYFGDLTLYNKYLNGSQTSLNFRQEKNSQALVFTLPNMEFEAGSAPATGSNQDVMLPLSFRAIRDATTDCTLQLDRFEEYGA